MTRSVEAILTLPGERVEELAARCAARALPGVPGVNHFARLRDLVMPVWAEFYHELIYGRPGTSEAREAIVAAAAKGPGHLAEERRLSEYIAARLTEVPDPLSGVLTPYEQVVCLRDRLFVTRVGQMAEAATRVLVALARDEDLQVEAAADPFLLEQVVRETTRPRPPRGGPADPPGPDGHFATVAIRAVVEEMLWRFAFVTGVTPSSAARNRGPCLVVPHGSALRFRRASLLFLRIRDGWECALHGLVRVLGTAPAGRRG